MHLKSTCRPCILLFFLCISVLHGTAQNISLSIKEVLDRVSAYLPQLEAVKQQAAATGEQIALAKNTSVPDLIVGYQVNMATYNNITGMSYPGFLLPVSGPPSVSNNLNFVPGSAIGALIKWNPVTFGQRQAGIDRATAAFKAVNAAYNEQLFRYQYEAVNTYLEALYYKELMKSLQAGIDRNRIGLEQALVLAKTGLKPGIDTTQFQSSLAQSEIDQLQTERIYLQKITEITRLTGLMNQAAQVHLTDTLSAQPILRTPDMALVIDKHPAYQSLQAQMNSTASSLKEIQRSWTPQLDFWGSAYARGSGVDASGVVNKWDGWGFSRTNMGVGLQLSFPVLQYSRVNIQKKQYQFLLKADESKLAQGKLDILKQTETAMMQYQQDSRIAAKAPMLLKAATEVYDGLQQSYAAGLIDYTRLSQGQYELLKAEVNQTNAHLQLWRSLLSVAIASGNLNLFADQLK